LAIFKTFSIHFCCLFPNCNDGAIDAEDVGKSSSSVLLAGAPSTSESEAVQIIVAPPSIPSSERKYRKQLSKKLSGFLKHREEQRRLDSAPPTAAFYLR
jgi:hypothetical protein